MAVNLSPPEKLLPVPGVSLVAHAAGLRYQGRDDLLLIKLCEGANSAGVFTKSSFSAAPVQVARAHLEAAMPSALLVNAGNANAATGELGLVNAKDTCKQVADDLQIEPEKVLPFSTGVIGEQFDMPKMQGAIDSLMESAESSSWLSAAKAIMTTDTVAKAISSQLEIDGQVVTITGIAKGSGMICPNMATMLSFVATDANIEAKLLGDLIKKVVEQSFNRITVDSDTSTNDALILSSTGKAKHSLLSEMSDANTQRFYKSLEGVMQHLAHSIVRDGEGATKFIKVAVQGGVSEADCEEVAYSIAHSPLVKTALFASDPNWGRLLMAVGKAENAQIDQNKLSLTVNGVDLLRKGVPANDYSEERGQAAFNEAEITINVDIGLGDSDYHVWTSDLSHDYVSINADYRS